MTMNGCMKESSYVFTFKMSLLLVQRKSWAEILVHRMIFLLVIVISVGYVFLNIYNSWIWVIYIFKELHGFGHLNF